MKGEKYDTGKPRFSLLPLYPLLEVISVLEFGARKYAKNNWQKVKAPKERYIDAAVRHIMASLGGEKLDPESGKYHLAHAVCCLMFALWFEQGKPKHPIDTSSTASSLPRHGAENEVSSKTEKL